MKILIVKTSSLGDIIHTFPFIAELKRRFPDAQIDYAVEEPFSALLDAHPMIQNSICLSSQEWRKGQNLASLKDFIRRLRSETYDLLFDLQGNIKSGLVTRLARALKKIGFGYQTVAEWPNLLFTDTRVNPPKGKNIRHDYLYFLTSVFAEETNSPEQKVTLQISEKEKDLIDSMVRTCKPKVMVAAGAAWPNKTLPINDLKTFLHTFSSHTCFYFIWGNEEEKRGSEELHRTFKDRSILTPKLALPALQNLMAKMDLVVAMDSLPLHLAATTKVATFAFFGPSSGSKYAPNDQFVQGSCPYSVTFEKRCPHLRTCKTAECMKNFTFNLER